MGSPRHSRRRAVAVPASRIALVVVLAAGGAWTALGGEPSPEANRPGAKPTEGDVGEAHGKRPVYLERLEDLTRQAPPFEVTSRKEHFKKLEDEDGLWPCSDCHDPGDFDGTPRVLGEDHEGFELHHGDGRFWCFGCHNPDDRDTLRDIAGRKVPYEKSWLLCGQCHEDKFRDFLHGAHGKRLQAWKGKRLLLHCVECHNPHDPAIKPRMPWRAPKVRRGLERRPAVREEQRIWERLRKMVERQQEGSHE